MCVLTMLAVALYPATMLARLTRNDRLLPCTVSWTRCTVSPSVPAACSSTAACSTPPLACSTSMFRFSVAARISLSNNGSSAFMRANKYSDSATGFLSCINRGTSKPTSSANAPAPTQRAISTIIRLLSPLSDINISWGQQAIHAPFYRRIPKAQRTTINVNGTPSSQRMNPFPMMPSLSLPINNLDHEHSLTDPTPSGGWPGPLHALLLAQGSPPRLSASWDHPCRHRRPFHDSCRSQSVRQSGLP